MTSHISDNTRQRICSHLQRGKLTPAQIAKICGVNTLTVKKVRSAMLWLPPAADALPAALSAPRAQLQREVEFSITTRAKARAKGKTQHSRPSKIGEKSSEERHSQVSAEVDDSQSRMIGGFGKSEQNGEDSDKSATAKPKPRKLRAESMGKSQKRKKWARAEPERPDSARKREESIRRARHKYTTLDYVTQQTVLKAKHLLRVDTKLLRQISVAAAAKLGLDSFRGSVNWLTGFKRRSGIRLRTLGAPEHDMSAFDAAKVVERVVESVVRDCCAAVPGDVVKTEPESLVKSEGAAAESEGPTALAAKEARRRAAEGLGRELEALFAGHFRRFEKRLAAECFHLHSPFLRAKKRVLREARKLGAK